MSAYGIRTKLERNWKRMEYFRHFYDDAPCSVSLADDIDVSELRQSCHDAKQSFYLAMLYTVSHVINAHEEFRMTAVDAPDQPYPMPAVWDAVNPVHNVFHADSDTYTALFSLWHPDYGTFIRYAEEDISRAKHLSAMSVPCGENTFEASCIPWRHFSSVGVQSEAIPLSPIVVWGGFLEQNGRTKMPLSIQIHHAAADGYHLARFLNEAEETARTLAKEIAGRRTL